MTKNNHGMPHRLKEENPSSETSTENLTNGATQKVEKGRLGKSGETAWQKWPLKRVSMLNFWGSLFVVRFFWKNFSPPKNFQRSLHPEKIFLKKSEPISSGRSSSGIISDSAPSLKLAAKNHWKSAAYPKKVAKSSEPTIHEFQG